MSPAQGIHTTVSAQQFFPHQKKPYYPQIPHRNKLYFSSLSGSDFGILSHLTAAVSQKTRRVPACLRNHCSQPGSRINENILVFAPSASSLQACWSTRHCCAGFAVREDNGYQSHQSTLTRRASYKHLAGFMSLGKSH